MPDRETVTDDDLLLSIEEIGQAADTPVLADLAIQAVRPVMAARDGALADAADLRRTLLGETYRPEGGEIVMRELGRVEAERDEALAEVERLRVLLGIDEWPPEMEPANIREIAATEVRRVVAAERDTALARLAASSLYDALYDAMYGDTSVGAEEREAVAQLAESLAAALAVPADPPKPTVS